MASRGPGAKAEALSYRARRARVCNSSSSYVRSDGRTISASGSYGVVTSKVAKATGIRARAGQLIAFLPRKAVMPTGAEHGLDRAPSLEVSVTDIDGYVVDQDRWGER